MEVGEGLKCNTAPGITFPDREALYAHYKTDWHRYNLKRRVANLAPISKEVYENLMNAISTRKKSKDSKSGKQDHIKKDKREKAKRRKEKQREASIAGQKLPASPPKAPKGPVILDEDAAIEAAKNMEFNACQCIFETSTKFPNVEENLEYMLRNYGFFVPDAEYVSDINQLIEYLHFKVQVGKHCLFCERSFPTSMACMQHMVDKNHCKLRYETDEDLEELEDFYDFSTESDEEEAGENEKEGVPSSKSKKKKTTVEMLDSGELLLTDGDRSRRIGIRQFKRYYDQRYRPEESRESVLAANKERLLLCYKQAGIETTSTTLTLAMPKIRTKESRLAVRARKVAHKAQQKRQMQMSIQTNLLIKNRVAGKNLGAGYGVHG